jgi:hypothetical protein
MSLQVTLSLAERFLNWMPTTKLYIRGQRGKDWAAQRELDTELAGQLVKFFKMVGIDDLERENTELKAAIETLWKRIGHTLDVMPDLMDHPMWEHQGMTYAGLRRIRSALTGETPTEIWKGSSTERDLKQYRVDNEVLKEALEKIADERGVPQLVALGALAECGGETKDE